MSKKNLNIALVLTLLVLLVVGANFFIRDMNSSSMRRNWKVEIEPSNGVLNYTLTSPVFTVDKIYKSMRGPTSGHGFEINTNTNKIHWITNYKVQAFDSDNNPVSEDFICHNNLDFNKQVKAKYWSNTDTADQTYPRLFTLTQGQTELRFPHGFGIPVKDGEQFSVLTQVLNHNMTKGSKEVYHKVELTLEENNQNIKPLFQRTLFIMLPFNSNEKNSKLNCIPVDPNDHRYTNEMGGVSSGHWVIDEGISYYHSNVTEMLDLDMASTLHYIGVHTHPFAEEVILIDKTLDSVIFRSACDNFENKIGLKKIELFSDKNGILLSHLHDYEMAVRINNTSNEKQDMMASMFLYFYDSQLDSLLSKE